MEDQSELDKAIENDALISKLNATNATLAQVKSQVNDVQDVLVKHQNTISSIIRQWHTVIKTHTYIHAYIYIQTYTHTYICIYT